ncbi:MAG: sigma-54 factor interaction domain-containing protein [Acidobacteriota bacterium]
MRRAQLYQKSREKDLRGIMIRGLCPEWEEAEELVERVSPTSAPVLLRGESGTGKELIANAIHFNSRRSRRQFVVVNCAAIPGELLESELFGHAKGAFTGATFAKIGEFEKADGGTLFLDEIGDLTLPLQVKLLRAFSRARSRASAAATRRARSTCASSPPPTATSRP